MNSEYAKAPISPVARQRLPVKSRDANGRITPIFGRTQYFFGEVVLTCYIFKYPSHQNRNWYKCECMKTLGLKLFHPKKK